MLNSTREELKKIATELAPIKARLENLAEAEKLEDPDTADALESLSEMLGCIQEDAATGLADPDSDI